MYNYTVSCDTEIGKFTYELPSTNELTLDNKEHYKILYDFTKQSAEKVGLTLLGELELEEQKNDLNKK